VNKVVDLIGAGLFVLLGLAVIVAALTFPEVRIEYDPIGPMGFPLALGAILAAGGGVQIYRTLRKGRSVGRYLPPEGAEDEPGEPSSTPRALGFIAGAFAYVALLNPLGYPVATPIFVGLGLWAMGYRTKWRLAVASVGYTVVSFAVFSNLLSVPVPTGILTDLLVALRVIDDVR
jgi:putative tricarboxylic transport membrane protein